MSRERARSRIALGAACALLVAASVAGSAEGIGVSSSKCRPVDSKTLARDPHARVYSLPARGVDADTEAVRVFGCLFGPGRSFRLGTTLPSVHSPGRIDPEEVALATPFAAYPMTTQGVDFNVVSVTVRNLRTGISSSIPRAIPFFAVEQVSSITDIVVTPSGSAAWIGMGKSLAGGGGSVAVSAAGLGKPVTVLDQGPGIDLESLELNGDQLTWLDEGVLYSAEIP